MPTDPSILPSGPGQGENHLRTAVMRLEHHDARAALVAASDACHAARARPEPHYVYGQAWAALNEPARAEQAFAAALRLAPGWADAWVNYGIARYRQNAIEDAKTAMREALRADPDHAAASSNLGAFLRLTGESEAAEILLRAALARRPGEVGPRLNLVADLLQQERAAEALAFLDEAKPPNEPAAHCHWLLQRALALLQLGRTFEAGATLRALAALGPVPAALAPLWHWRHVLLALAEGDRDRAARDAERMEAALDAMGTEALPEHRIMAHYDLAKFWSGWGAPARAFPHWICGHQLLAAMQPFSRSDHLAVIEAQIEAFDAARLAHGPRAGNTDPAPVFIVGMPRSGTTLCEQILAAHRDVHGAGERLALGRMAAGLGGGTKADHVKRLASRDAGMLDRAAASYLAELRGLAPGKARVVDKMPGNYLHLGFAGLMLPGARMIHCTRDPRDIGLSIFTFRFHGAHPYAHDLRDLGWTIAQQSRLMAHWRAVLPGRILTVALSDWVEDFDGTLARVLAHLDLPPDPDCARFHERGDRVRTVSWAQVRHPVNGRGLGRWRSYERELEPLVQELDRVGSFEYCDKIVHQGEMASVGGFVSGNLEGDGAVPGDLPLDGSCS